MDGGEKKFGGDFLRDTISALHDSVVIGILDHLSLRDAVRTSVLSKRWRYCWTRVAKINFDWNSMETYFQVNVNRIIDSVLSRHEGPIREFFLSAYLDGDHTFKIPIRVGDSKDVRHWMQLLSDNGICKISFLVEYPSFVPVPSCILNCSTLTHLRLRYCALGPRRDFMGASNLVDLRLINVHVSAWLLEAVISASAGLKVLQIDHLLLDFEGTKRKPVVINAPGLETLDVQEFSQHFFVLRQTLNLTFANVHFGLEVPRWCKEKTTKLDYLVQIMPGVETLKLNYDSLTSLASGDIPMKLPTTLQNLKDLEFIWLDIFSLNRMACAFCLIRSSPNLKSLVIYVRSGISYKDDDLAAAVRFYDAQEKEGILSHISKVKFAYLVGNDCEVKLISLFLNCCPMLKTAVISSRCSINLDSESWLFKELANLRRPESVTMEFLSPKENTEQRLMMMVRVPPELMFSLDF